MEEELEKKSNRDRHLERLRGKYPDKEFADDEAIYGQIGEDYDAYEQELERYRKDDKALSDMFAADPRSAQFLQDMQKGKSPWASYIRLYGPELKDSLDNPDVIEQIAEAERDYVERVAQSRELDAEYERNMEQTIATLNQFKEERGMSDEEMDNVVAALIGIVRDGVMGKFLPETLDMMMKAINHDSDVAMASEEGEVAGRNARITEQLRKSSKGDGLAPLDGKNGMQGAGNKVKSVFDWANEA